MSQETVEAVEQQPAYVLRPPAWRIAEHWFNVGEFVVDLSEPACFACRWRDDRAPRPPSVSIADAWTRSSLERAHLVPHALGGSDSDVSNYLILCPPCHKTAPDWRDPEVMLRWVRGQKHYLMAKVGEALTTWAQLWPGRSLTAALIEGVDPAAMSALLMEKAGTHAHRLKPATILTALGELTGAPAGADTASPDRIPSLLLALLVDVERAFTAERFANIRAATAAAGRRTARSKAHTEAQIEEARRLRDQGDSLSQIVSKTGIPKSSLRRYLKSEPST